MGQIKFPEEKKKIQNDEKGAKSLVEIEEGRRKAIARSSCLGTVIFWVVVDVVITLVVCTAIYKYEYQARNIMFSNRIEVMTQQLSECTALKESYRNLILNINMKNAEYEETENELEDEHETGYIMEDNHSELEEVDDASENEYSTTEYFREYENYEDELVDKYSYDNERSRFKNEYSTEYDRTFGDNENEFEEGYTSDYSNFEDENFYEYVNSKYDSLSEEIENANSDEILMKFDKSYVDQQKDYYEDEYSAGDYMEYGDNKSEYQYISDYPYESYEDQYEGIKDSNTKSPIYSPASIINDYANGNYEYDY